MLNRKNQNTELAAALAALRAEFNDHETANEYGFSELESRLENLDELVDQYTGLPCEVEDVNYRVNDVESRIDDLESVNSELLESRVDELEGQVDAQANIIRDLELTIAELGARIVKLHEWVDGVIFHVTDIHEEVK